MKFLIVCQPRTGSQFLAHLLNSHPKITCELELLGQPVWNPQRFLSHRALLADSDGYGLKVKPFQLLNIQRLDVREWLLQRAGEGWKIVHLQRRNLLRKVLSGSAARQHNRFHRFPGQEPLRLKVDTDRLLHRLRVRKERTEFEQECLAGIDRFQLFYEDDLMEPAGRQESLNGLLRWLDLPEHQLHTNMLRNTPSRLEDYLENYQDVRVVLADTEFEKFLLD